MVQPRTMGGILEMMNDRLIQARYEALIHHPHWNILGVFTMEELYLIGERANACEKAFALCYPFSFAALMLSDKQEIARRFEALSFAWQCRVLDVAPALTEGDEPLALIGLDYEHEQTILLSLAKTEELLFQRAKDYVKSPFIREMIDPGSETDLLATLDLASLLLEQEIQETPDMVLTIVPTSDELFVSWLFAPLLECPFIATMGEKRDGWNRVLPCYLDIA